MTPKDKRDLVLLVILTLIIAFACCSCKTKTVVVSEYHTDTLYKVRTDTLREMDSVYKEKQTIIREVDSLQLLEYGIALRENERAILVLQRELERERNSREEHSTDTIYEHKTDSIPVIVEVEKSLTWWQGTKIKFFPWLLILCIGLLVYVLRKPIWKLIKMIVMKT